MELGLCMVVRDESQQLVACLSPVLHLFDQVAIVDTGSGDGTPTLLRQRFGIEVLHHRLDEERCGCLCDPRKAALSRLSTPWVFLLDADERLDPRSLQRIRALPDDPGVAGYFGRWLNRATGDGDFEDYKLFLFRHGLQPLGLVHDVVQLDIRARGLRAEWLDGLDVVHLPDASRRPSKARRYRQRLLCALERQPEFYRYHWFLGYMAFCEGQWDAAVELLSHAAEAGSPQFPVECLNSAMVLAEIHARRQDRAALAQTLCRARSFHQQVAEDFEVRINFRLGPWLAAAWSAFCNGRLERIRAYRFAR